TTPLDAWNSSGAAGLRRRVALLGAALLAACPLPIFVSMQLLSDVPALVWTTGALLCAWRARTRVAWAWVAGGVFAVAVLIRPTNALALVPLAIVLGKNWGRWRRTGLAGLPFAIALGLYNRAAYGHPLRFGYGAIGEAFGLEYLGVTLVHYLTWLPVLLAGVGVLAPAILWVRGVKWTWRAALVAWVVVLTGFYAVYPFTFQDWWGLRFVLPAFPAMIVAALLVGQSWLGRWRETTQRVVLAGTAVWCVAWGAVWSSSLRSLRTGSDERMYVNATDWVRAELPEGAVIFGGQMSGSLHYYTKFVTVNWGFATPEDSAKIVRGARADGRAVYAMLFPFEEAMLQERPMPGAWQPAGRLKHITLWKLADAAGR
ncbi:MAG: hypothetical protein V4773_30665, partial [Verrucomicrobiota bacterium]